MKNNCEINYEMRKNRLFLWLAVLLTILLVLAIGVFVFLALNAKYQYVCLFDCQQQEGVIGRGQGSLSSETASIATVTTAVSQTRSTETAMSEKTTLESKIPTEMSRNTKAPFTIDQNLTIRSEKPSTVSPAFVNRKTTNSVTSNSTSLPVLTQVNLHNTRKPRVNVKKYIKIRGNISFIGKAQKRFPRNSRLIVEFKEDLRSDGPSILLAKTAVDLSSYRKGKTLSYTISCKMPKFAHESYSVSAVLNVGWKPRRNKNEWIRRGDYFTDTFFDVHISKHKRLYIKHIQLIKYI